MRPVEVWAVTSRRVEWCHMTRINTAVANVQDVKRLHLIVRDRCGTEGHLSFGRRADRETAWEFFTALSGMWIAVRRD